MKKFTKEELKNTMYLLSDWRDGETQLTQDDKDTIFEQFVFLVKERMTKNIVSSQKIGIVGDGAVVTGLHMGDL